MRVAVIGLGKLGACLAGVLAQHHFVTGYDVDPAPVDAIRAGIAPVDEPGLQDLISTAGLGPGRLGATVDLRLAVAQSDLAFIVVPTPSASDGRFDSALVFDALCGIEAALNGRAGYVAAIVSTVMPGTCARLSADASFEVVYNPAFIALGSVVHDFTHPDVVLIGADGAGEQRVLKALRPCLQSHADIHLLTTLDAEMAKLALNVALSVKIAYAHEVTRLAERIGANATSVLAAVGSDSRIGPKFLAPGPTAAGPCLPRDLVAFDRLAALNNRPAFMADAARRWHRIEAATTLGELLDLSRIQHRARPEIVGVLGLAYKPGTHVTDESIGRRVVEHALHAGLDVLVHDPVAPWLQLHEPQKVLDAADVVLVATPWPEYAHLDYSRTPTLDLWGIVPPGPTVHRFGQRA